jgi:hypothetical protein
MKTMTTTRAAIAFIASFATGIAAAAGTHTLTIGTTIISAGNCQFDTPGPTLMNFGNIDPSSLTNATVTVNIPFRCTGGGAAPTITWSVSSDAGLYETGPTSPRLRHAVNLTQFLPYTLNIPASGTVAKNALSNLAVVGTIQVADFAAAMAGAYLDSVVLTMAP